MFFYLKAEREYFVNPKIVELRSWFSNLLVLTWLTSTQTHFGI